MTDMVSEHPDRIGYVDTLNHLVHADAILVLGSTEPHYTPSKVFQAALSKRPVLAMLHEASTAVDMVRCARIGRVLTLREGALPKPDDICRELDAVLKGDGFDPAKVDWSAFGEHSARQSSRQLADAMDRALDRSY